MFYSAMAKRAAKQISLFTTGSHLRDKSLNVGFGSRGELGGMGQRLSHTKQVSTEKNAGVLIQMGQMKGINNTSHWAQEFSELMTAVRNDQYASVCITAGVR